MMKMIRRVLLLVMVMFSLATVAFAGGWEMKTSDLVEGYYRVESRVYGVGEDGELELSSPTDYAYEFDDNGLMIKKTVDFGFGFSITEYEYVYDENNNCVEEYINGTLKWIYAYNSENLLLYKKSGSDPEYYYEYAYNEDGYLASLQEKHNEVINNETLYYYNTDGKLAKIEETSYWDGVAEYIITTIFTYNSDGTIATETETIATEYGSTSYVYSYTYDSAGRIDTYDRVTYENDENWGAERVVFEYDEIGNYTKAYVYFCDYDYNFNLQYVYEYKYEKFGPEIAEPEPAENPFTDVTEDCFYYAPVLWAVENSITKGTTDTTFAPEELCTRGQVVTFLWRTAGCPEPTSAECEFTDVGSEDYYYKAVLWATENGVTKGVSETEFDPDGECTRGQVVTFLWRTAENPASSGSNPFVDVENEYYYYNAVQWAAENGITKGITETTFEPDDTCTRSQVVTFLYRMYK